MRGISQNGKMATEYKCDICGKPASVHITKIIDNKKVKVHLCSECAEKASFDAVNLPMDILPKLQEFEKMIKKNIVKTDTCQTCGTSLAEIEKGSRFSCPDCYVALGNKLFEIFAGVHSATDHKGKSPKYHKPNCFAKIDVSKKLRDFEDIIGEEVFEENLESALEEIASLANKTVKIQAEVAKPQESKPVKETEKSLQKKLADAISEERYEDAAKLRDKLKTLLDEKDD